MGWWHAAPDPGEPDLHHCSEQEVWERLRDTLGDDDVLLANLRLTDGDKDHEADLVVLMPDIGVARARGQGRQRHGRAGRRRGTRWWTQSGGGRRQIRPVDQARDAKYALRRYVDQHPRGGTTRRVGVGTRGGRSLLAVRRGLQRPRAAALGTARQGRPAGARGAGPRRRRGGCSTATARRPTTTSRCITDILTGRFAHALRRQRGGRRPRGRVRPAHHGAGHDPPRHPAADPRRGARWRRQRQDRARPPAGQGADPWRSGPQGRSASRCSATRSGSRSTSSRRWRRGTAATGRRSSARSTRSASSGAQPTATARTASSGRSAAGRDGRAGRGAARQHKYDAVIVDEAQDFADSWWTPVLRSLRDEEQGGLYVYSDENQRIFARFGRPPVPSCRSCSTTTSATPSRSTTPSDPSRPAGCTRGVATVRPSGSSLPPRTTPSRRPTTRSIALLESAGSPATSPCSPPVTATRSRSSGPTSTTRRATGAPTGTTTSSTVTSSAARDSSASGRALPQRGRITRPCPRAALRRDVARHRRAGRRRRSRHRSPGRGRGRGAEVGVVSCESGSPVGTQRSVSTT